MGSKELRHPLLAHSFLMELTPLSMTNLLADLHGKIPAPSMRSSSTCPPPVRWNVSHCPEFHQPDPSLPTLEEEKAAAAKSRKNDDMFSFEVTSHPLPTTYKFRDRSGEWVLYRDLKDYTKKYCSKKEDIRSKGDLLELKKSEFLKHSHCNLLDRRGVEVRFHARDNREDIVILVRVDKFVRKIFNSKVIHVVPTWCSVLSRAATCSVSSLAVLTRAVTI